MKINIPVVSKQNISLSGLCYGTKRCTELPSKPQHGHMQDKEHIRAPVGQALTVTLYHKIKKN